MQVQGYFFKGKCEITKLSVHVAGLKKLDWRTFFTLSA